MLKNNIFALLAQIICFCVYFTILVPLGDFIIGGGILSVLMWFVYIFIGTKLTPQSSVIKNMLSVFSVGILGLITGIISYGKSYIAGVFQQLLAVFIVPSSGVLLLFSNFTVKHVILNKLILLIITFIPSILMGIGLQWKTRSINRKQLK